MSDAEFGFKEKIGVFFLICCIVAFAFFMTFYDFQDVKGLAHDFCVESGFDGLTDSYFALGDIFVECDGKHIFSLAFETVCVGGVDKWGRCTKSDKILVERVDK